MAKRVAPAHELFKEHKGNELHLCHLVRERKMDKVADLAKDAKFVGHICGRAAAEAKHLCEPVEI